MPNKAMGRLDPVDRILRKAFPPNMTDPSVQITIEKICGFELFNTRAYHNYETWSDGWRVSGFGVQVEDEDLDDAVRKFVLKAKGKLDE